MTTRANSACRHPERYTAPDVFATEDQVTELVAGFIRALQPDYAIETGTYKGHTAQAIGQALQRNGYGHLDTLELDPARAAEARERCRGLPVMVHTIDSATFVPGAPIEFAWLDSHFLSRERELRRFRRWFIPGAVIGVHDTGDQFRLRQRLEPIEAERWIRFEYFPTLRGVAFGVVR